RTADLGGHRDRQALTIRIDRLFHVRDLPVQPVRDLDLARTGRHRRGLLAEVRLVKGQRRLPTGLAGGEQSRDRDQSGSAEHAPARHPRHDSSAFARKTDTPSVVRAPPSGGAYRDFIRVGRGAPIAYGGRLKPTEGGGPWRTWETS